MILLVDNPAIMVSKPIPWFDNKHGKMKAEALSQFASYNSRRSTNKFVQIYSLA